MKLLNLRTLFPSFSSWVVLAALAPILAGCVGAAVVGVGAAGALLMTDRRITETYLTDEGIETRISNRINEKFSNIHVNATSYNRTVLLTGEVRDAATREGVENIVKAVPNVKAIQNEIQIAGNTSLTARSNDTFITSKVKGRFLDAQKFSPNHVKVVTEAGVVYLMGLVTKQEADAAVEVARTTGGVLKVVRVLEIISEEQARQLDNLQPVENTSSQPTSSPKQ